MGGIIHDIEDMHARAITSDEYDPTKSYVVGDYCIRENVLYRCIEDTTDVWNSTSWEATNVGKEITQVTDSLNTRFTSNITSAKICFRHFLFSGSIVAGQCVKLGGIINAIPVGYDLVGVLLTPRASVHIAMSWLPDEEYSIYAYSETFSGVFSYDALVILAR